MNTRFPAVPSDYQQRFFNQLFNTLQGFFTRVVSHDEEVPHIILSSPNGTRYTVSVTDAGVVTTAPTGKPPL